MARVTVEDCATIVENHFELVALATLRTKEIESGSEPTLERGNKTAVTSLREIASKSVDCNYLREKLIASLQNKHRVDNVPEENLHAENEEEVADDYEATEINDLYISETDLDFSADDVFGDEDAAIDAGDEGSSV
jgi:DNA-directed RNA polymerase subunit omega